MPVSSVKSSKTGSSGELGKLKVLGMGSPSAVGSSAGMIRKGEAVSDPAIWPVTFSVGAELAGVFALAVTLLSVEEAVPGADVCGLLDAFSVVSERVGAGFAEAGTVREGKVRVTGRTARGSC